MIFLAIIVALLAIPLLAVTVRRWALTISALLIKSDAVAPVEEYPPVLALIPARNEADVIESCVRSISHVDWPRYKLKIIVVDDGSADDTPVILDRLISEDSRIRVIRREPDKSGLGKAAAMSAALEAESFGELIYVLDADARVRPDALRRLAGKMLNGDFAAVQGRMSPANPDAGLAAFYTSVESWVHQGITQPGANGLGLAVSLLGSNYLVERRALEAVGGFHWGSRLEDVDLTLDLLNAGHRIVFVPEADSTIIVSESAGNASRQHRAWSQAFFEIAARHWSLTAKSKTDAFRKLDRIIYSLGYFDRPLLLLFAVLTFCLFLAGSAGPWPAILALLIATPALQCLLALYLHKRPIRDYMKLFVMPVGLLLEFALHLRALVDAVRRKQNAWERTSRSERAHD